MQQEQLETQFSRQDANQLIPSVEAAYFGLIIKGKYLPKITSSIITSNYLVQVLFEKHFVPDTAQIRIGTLLRAVKKYLIIEELTSLHLDQSVSWGFDLKHQPDKQWAVNVLYTLKPNHNYFKKYSPEKYDMKKFTQAEIMKIRTLDITQGKRSSVRRFFRIPKEQQQQLAEQKLNARKQLLEQKIKRKTQVLDEVEEDIKELDAKMREI